MTIGLGTATRLTASYYYLESHELPDSGIALSLRLLGDGVQRADRQHLHHAGARQRHHGGRADRLSSSARPFTAWSIATSATRTSQQATIRVEHDFGGVTLRNTARFTNDDQAYSFLLPDDSTGNVFGTAATNRPPARPVRAATC